MPHYDHWFKKRLQPKMKLENLNYFSREMTHWKSSSTSWQFPFRTAVSPKISRNCPTGAKSPKKIRSRHNNSSPLSGVQKRSMNAFRLDSYSVSFKCTRNIWKHVPCLISLYRTHICFRSQVLSVLSLTNRIGARCMTSVRFDSSPLVWEGLQAKKQLQGNKVVI